MNRQIQTAARRNFRASLTAAFSLAAALPCFGASEISKNGSFESDFANWSASGNVRVQPAPPPLVAYSVKNGARSVAFNAGNTAPNGVLAQVLATVPGQLYSVTFEMGVLGYNTSAQSLEVSVTGSAPQLYSMDGTGLGFGGWRYQSFNFTATAATTQLTFRDRSTVTAGIDLLLDVVSVLPPFSNGGFESPAPTWTATGNARIIATPLYQPTEGKAVANFNAGNSAPNGTLSQGFSTIPGRDYVVIFDLGAFSYVNQEQKVEVRVESASSLVTEVFTVQGQSGGNTRWEPKTFAFDARQPSAVLTFKDVSTATSSIDLLVDNVKVVEVPPGFVLISPGTSIIGRPADDPGSFNKTRRSVTFKNYLLAESTEVTWSEWQQYRVLAQSRGYNDIAAGRNGGNGSPDGTHPVTEVSYWDVLKWCNLRSEVDGLKPVYYTSPGFGAANVLRNGSPEPYADWKADGYRLPTEAEWENLCRAGSTTEYFNGPVAPVSGGLDATLDISGWYFANSGGNTHSVATKIPNAWGLYDTHGNVWEWCWDRFDDMDYPPGPLTDPHGPTVGTDRMIRGGAYIMIAYWCTSDYRAWHENTSRWNYLGFRPVRAVVR